MGQLSKSNKEKDKIRKERAARIIAKVNRVP